MFDPTWRPPVLTGRRVCLRPFDEADADELFQHARNPNVTRHTLWDAHQSRDDTLTFVRDYARGRYLEGVPEPVAITLADGGAIVGAAGAHWASQKNRCMEIGYWLAEPY